MLVTKRDIQWKRSFSAFNDVITFPAGSKVEEVNGIYWIDWRQKGLDTILKYDLIHYGCYVEFNNVHCTDIFVRTENNMHQISEEVFIELNKYNNVRGGVSGYVSQVGTRFLEMKEEDFVKALMYSIEKSYEYGCINNELLDAEVLNSIKLKEYNVDDKN